MFIVYEKSSGEMITVYNIRHDKHGYPHFLIYEDGQWKYRSAKHYTPITRDIVCGNFPVMSADVIFADL